MTDKFWLAVLVLPFAAAQTFEVATIKPAPESALRSLLPGLTPPCSGGPGTSSPLRLSCTGFTLHRLIEYAYDVRSAQVDGPGWMDEQNFDVVASVPAGATSAEARAMMQRLLAERFHLQLRRERKVQPLYRLTIAKSGFKRALIDDLTEEKRAAAELQSRSAFMKGSQERIARGDSRPWFRLVVIGPREKFVEVISRRLDHPVLDETALKGSYDFSAEWLTGDVVNPGGPAPDMFAALEEQLGLKLERTQGELDLILVESASKLPDEN